VYGSYLEAEGAEEQDHGHVLVVRDLVLAVVSPGHVLRHRDVVGVLYPAVVHRVLRHVR